MTRLFILFLALAAMASAHAQGAITLKPVVRTQMDEPITLGDIALLEGAAGAHADLAIVPEPGVTAGADRRLSVTLADVRTKLEQRVPEDAGRFSYTGESCQVILRPKKQPRSQHAPAEPAATTAPALGLTVRDHIEAKLVQTLGVSMGDLELTFEDADAALLASATRGWTVVVEPTGSSSRMPMRITMYDERGEIRDVTLRVGVRILRDIVRTTRALRRGETLTSDDYEIDQAWLAPDVPYVEPTHTGAIRLKRAIGAGEMLTSGHAEMAEVVKRGDIVSVHAISGTIVMRTEARALESGRIGDTIELEPLQTKGRFAAQVKAPGRVVAIAQATPLRAHSR